MTEAMALDLDLYQAYVVALGYSHIYLSRLPALSDEEARHLHPANNPDAPPWSYCECGMAMTLNPAPDAGSPRSHEAGYSYECVPCLLRKRTQLGHDRNEAQAALRVLATVNYDLEPQLANLRAKFTTGGLDIHELIQKLAIFSN